MPKTKKKALPKPAKTTKKSPAKKASAKQKPATKKPSKPAKKAPKAEKVAKVAKAKSKEPKVRAKAEKKSKYRSSSKNGKISSKLAALLQIPAKTALKPGQTILDTAEGAEKLRELVTFVSFGRGAPIDGGAAQVPLDRSGLPLPIERLSRKIDISSTEIRTRVAKGLPIQYLVPESVRLLIHSHALYKHPV